ncbi:hypothetical protein C0580_03075 [Candidatus Parcubacteria bacterium]|nr:MAG: hypothetical protein C0580_03075 [Candidatus Parcubacteria bacterium]
MFIDIIKNNLFSQLIFVFILLFLLYLYYKDLTKDKVIKIKRGLFSWSLFPITYTIISIILLEIIDEITYFNNYSLFIKIIILIVIFHLTFFNGFFRIKIVNLFSKSKELEE